MIYLEIILLVSLSIFNAGQDSEIFLHLRAIDIILFLFTVLVLFNTTHKKKEFNRIFILFLFLLAIGLLGIGNPFFFSDARYLFALFLSFIIIFKMVTLNLVQLNILFLITALVTILIYLSLNFGYLFYGFYGNANPGYFYYKQGRTLGPSIIFIEYLFILLSLNGQRKMKHNIIFLFLLIVVYSTTLGRQTLVVGLLILFAVNFFNNRIRTKLIILFSATISLFVITYNFIGSNWGLRLISILHPFQSSSFNYRITSDLQFLNNYVNFTFFHKFLGFGFGPQRFIYMGSYLGFIPMNILDNSILTILLKFGLIGLLIFIYLYSHPFNNLEIKTKIILIIPIFFGGLLSAHLFTDIHYYFGLMFFTRHIKYFKRV